MNYAVGPIISKRANIGWNTGGHGIQKYRHAEW